MSATRNPASGIVKHSATGRNAGCMMILLVYILQDRFASMSHAMPCQKVGARAELIASCLQLIARLGRWLRTALNMSYLRFFKPKGLLAAAGFDQDQPFGVFAEHWCQPVLRVLYYKVYPFLEDFRKQASLVWLCKHVHPCNVGIICAHKVRPG